MRRQAQILVIGSAFDIFKPDPAQKVLAQEIGGKIAESGSILVYGAEPDVDSYPTVAARAARKKGGVTVAFPPNSSKKLFDQGAASIICPLSVDRGGPREALLSRMGDVVILIRGGSGGATEALAAYQALIPLICMKGSGGWADRFLESPIDERAEKRVVLAAETGMEAVDLALKLFRRRCPHCGKVLTESSERLEYIHHSGTSDDLLVCDSCNFKEVL